MRGAGVPHGKHPTSLSAGEVADLPTEFPQNEAVFRWISCDSIGSSFNGRERRSCSPG